MKKIILLVSLLLLVGIMTFVYAAEIKPIQSSSLNSGNGVCEYYQKEFSTGQQDTITINGATLNIKYLGDKNWKVNDYEGKLQNHDFFANNQNSKLKGIRFDFSFMEQSQPGGNFGLREQDYYPWDCQGYSQSSGLISEIKIKEGWNLVPTTISLRDCYYALEGELCKDDVLVSYYYIPTLNKYFTLEEIEKKQNDPQIKEYFSEENEFKLMKSSKWIYVKPGSGSKKVIGDFGAYIPYRTQYLDNGAYKLSSGWNFLFVDAFMIYDDTWNSNPLSINDMKGDCNIERAYLWDIENQEWGTFLNLLDDKRFLRDTAGIGQGFVIKVTNECALKYSAGTTPPPTLPN